MRLESLQQRKTKVMTYMSVILAAFGMIVISATSVYVIIQGQRQNRALCQLGEDNRDVMFSILTLSEQTSLENARSLDQAEAIEALYDQYFALIPPIECGRGGPVELEP